MPVAPMMHRTSSSKQSMEFWTGEIDGEIDAVDWFWTYWFMTKNARVMRVSVRWENVCDGYVAFGKIAHLSSAMEILENACLMAYEEPLGVQDYTWIGGRGYELEPGDMFLIEVDSMVLPNYCYISWMFEQL